MVEPLTRCPICRYRLTGLPKNHRCPECGFEYDQRTLAFYPGPSSSVGIWAFAIASYLQVVLVVATGSWSPLGFLSLMIITHVVLAHTALFVLYRHRPFIAVGPQGITYRRPLLAIRSIPWPRLTITQVTQRWVTRLGLKAVRLPEIRISGKGGGKRVRIPLGLLRAGDQIAAAEEIFRRWELQHPQGTDEGP